MSTILFDVAARTAFLDEHVGAHADRFDEDEAVPPSVISALAREGILGAAVAPASGGGGLSPRDFGELCASLGGLSASLLSLLTVHTMVSLTIQRWGSAGFRAKWLPLLARGDCLAAFALTESGSGSDVAAIRTEIRRDGDRLVINGGKRWISFAQAAHVFFVVGQYNGRMSAVLVPRDVPGVTVKPLRGMLGFRAAMLADLEFGDCAVPVDNLVCGSDFGISQIVGHALDNGRFSIAWGAMGLADTCLRAALRHTSDRVGSGQALRDHALVRAMVTDMATGVRTSRLLCEDAARLRAEGSMDAMGTTLMAKYHASKVAVAVASDSIQLHGAQGFSAASPVQRMYRDAKVFEIIEGSTQLMQTHVAEYVWQAQARGAAPSSVPPMTTGGQQ